jgi:hypothetical protein
MCDVMNMYINIVPTVPINQPRNPLKPDEELECGVESQPIYIQKEAQNLT